MPIGTAQPWGMPSQLGVAIGGTWPWPQGLATCLEIQLVAYPGTGMQPGGAAQHNKLATPSKRVDYQRLFILCLVAPYMIGPIADFHWAGATQFAL